MVQYNECIYHIGQKFSERKGLQNVKNQFNEIKFGKNITYMVFSMM